MHRHKEGGYGGTNAQAQRRTIWRHKCTGTEKEDMGAPMHRHKAGQMICVGANQDWSTIAEHNLTIVAVGLEHSKITGILVEFPNANIVNKRSKRNS